MQVVDCPGHSNFIDLSTLDPEDESRPSAILFDGLSMEVRRLKSPALDRINGRHRKVEVRRRHDAMQSSGPVGANRIDKFDHPGFSVLLHRSWIGGPDALLRSCRSELSFRGRQHRRELLCQGFIGESCEQILLCRVGNSLLGSG